MARLKFDVVLYILLLFGIQLSLAQDGGFWWKKDVAKNHMTTNRTSKMIIDKEELESIFGKNEQNSFERFDDCIEEEGPIPDFFFPDDDLLTKFMAGNKETKRKCANKKDLTIKTDPKLIHEEESKRATQLSSGQNKDTAKYVDTHKHTKTNEGSLNHEPIQPEDDEYYKKIIMDHPDYPKLADISTDTTSSKSGSIFPTYSSPLGPIPIPIEQSGNVNYNFYKVPIKRTNNHPLDATRLDDFKTSDYSLDKPESSFSTHSPPLGPKPRPVEQTENVNYNLRDVTMKTTNNHPSNGNYPPIERYTSYSSNSYAKPSDNEQKRNVESYIHIPLIIKIPSFDRAMDLPYYQQNEGNANLNNFHNPTHWPGTMNQDSGARRVQPQSLVESHKNTQDGILSDLYSHFEQNAQESSNLNKEQKPHSMTYSSSQPLSQTSDEYKRSMPQFEHDHDHFHHHHHHHPHHFHHHPHHHFHNPMIYENSGKEFPENIDSQNSGTNTKPIASSRSNFDQSPKNHPPRREEFSRSHQRFHPNNQNSHRINQPDNMMPPVSFVNINAEVNPQSLFKTIENFVKNVGVLKFLSDIEKNMPTRSPRPEQATPKTTMPIPVNVPKTVSTTTPRTRVSTQTIGTTTPRTITANPPIATTTPRTKSYPRTIRTTTSRTWTYPQTVRTTTPSTKSYPRTIRTTTARTWTYPQTVRTTPTTTSYPQTIKTTIPVTTSYSQRVITTTPVTRHNPQTIRTSTPIIRPYPETIRTTTPIAINYAPNIPDIHQKDETDGESIDYSEIFGVETTQSPDAEDCICVSYFLCNDGVINIDGVGVLDMRFSLCPNDYEVCCKLPKNSTTNSSTESSKPTTTEKIKNTPSQTKPTMTESEQIAPSIQNNQDFQGEVWPGLGGVGPEPSMTDSSDASDGCVCVYYFLCDDGVVNIDGTGVIDLRFSSCPDVNQVCCKYPSNMTNQYPNIQDEILPSNVSKDNPVESSAIAPNNTEVEIIDWDAFEPGKEQGKSQNIEEAGCVCVYDFLCADSLVNTFGDGIIDLRFNACPEENQVCCKKPLTNQP